MKIHFIILWYRVRRQSIRLKAPIGLPNNLKFGVPWSAILRIFTELNIIFSNLSSPNYKGCSWFWTYIKLPKGRPSIPLKSGLPHLAHTIWCSKKTLWLSNTYGKHYLVQRWKEYLIILLTSIFLSDQWPNSQTESTNARI